MCPDESKTTLKIVCSKCGQKLDVSEFESFTAFPCPVCENEITVPRILGEHVLIKELPEDDDCENFIGLKDDKIISLKVFKKEIEGKQGIEACLKYLTSQYPTHEFSESNGNLIGFSEKLEEVKQNDKEKFKNNNKQSNKFGATSIKKTKKKVKSKNTAKDKTPVIKSKTADTKVAPAKPLKSKQHSKSNKKAFITIGILAAIIALSFGLIPDSPEPETDKTSNLSESFNFPKANNELNLKKELEEEKPVLVETEKKEAKALAPKEEEKANREAEELARKEEEEKKKDPARLKEEERQKELADFLALIQPSEEQRKKFASLPPVSNTHFQKLMNKSCIDCHNENKRKGDLNAAMFTTPASIYISFERIKDIYASVKSGDMPPEDEEFSDDDREHLLAYIEKIIFTLESKPAKMPSTAMVRRLTPYEYDYTVQDVTGLDLKFAESFPAESGGGQGFVNDAQQLNVSPILMEKYMEAAESIASYSEFDLMKGYTFSKKSRDLIKPEEYGQKLRNQMYSYLKSYYPKKFSVQGHLPKLINACAEISRDKNKPLEKIASRHGIHPLFLKNGLKYLSNLNSKSKTESTILKDWSKLRSAPDADKIQKEISQQLVSAYTFAVTILNNRQHKQRSKYMVVVRNIESLFYVDKTTAAQSLEGNKLRDYLKISDTYYFSRFATNIRQGASVHAHLKPLIYKFLYKMYRRPPSEKELTLKVNDLLNDSIKLGFPMACRILLIREFCSFNFFFRIENKKQTKIDDYDLASRLSYFLWAGPPDEELLKLASENKLSEKEVLEKQISRMLKDKKSTRLAKHFAEQWLNLDKILKSTGPEKEIFSGFDKNLAKDMWMETAMCFNYVVKNDRSMLELISSNYTIINNRLSKIYGLKQKSPKFKKVYVKNGQRGGILGHASILTMTSMGKRTSPIVRGTWVLGVLLGTPPPPPPMDVEELPDGEVVSKDFSLKEQLAHHRNNPNCKSCHKKIDPLGVVLENYDTVGRWRESYLTKAEIDSLSKINGKSIEGPAGLKKYLMDNKILYIKNLSRKLLSYALGRDIHFHDNFIVNKMIENAIRDDYSFSSLVKTVISSPQFQHK